MRNGKKYFYVSYKVIKVPRVISLSFMHLGVKMSKIAKVVKAKLQNG